LTHFAWNAAMQDSTRRWTTDAIHDTVAAIARQPAYTTSIKQSLFGRFLRFVFDRLRDLRALLGGSPGIRIVVIGAAALLIVIIVARIIVSRRIENGRGHERTRGAGRHARTDYWQRARELAGAGDHVGASRALYAGVLDDLARSGAVRFHPSKTSGDYARELARRGSPSASAFQVFARHFEQIAYGTASTGAEEFERLTRAASGVEPTAGAA
jgi:hypothetical protein